MPPGDCLPTIPAPVDCGEVPEACGGATPIAGGPGLFVSGSAVSGEHVWFLAAYDSCPTAFYRAPTGGGAAQFALFHPLDDHYGLGSLDAAAGPMAVHRAAMTWNKALLDNAARPSGALVHEATEPLSADQFDRLRDELASGFSGEPRWRHTRKAMAAGQTIGDCVDCNKCVQVCPTGIDIRQGLQLECLACTACIDACDAIMTSIHKPTGLIRYASENSIKNKVKLTFNRRIKAYTAVLSLLILLLVFLLVSRTDLDARLMRTAGMTYTSLPDGRVSNLYNLKLANKTHKDIPVHLKLENIAGEVELVGNKTALVKKEDYTVMQFFVKLNRNELKSYKTELILGLYDSTKKIKTIKAKFIGPEIYN